MENFIFCAVLVTRLIHVKYEMADIGPQLPPHLVKNKNEATDIGPQLPPHLLKSKNENRHTGPQLPGHLSKNESENRCIGPQLLTDLAKSESEKSEDDDSYKDQYYGPSLPQSLKKEKSRIIGPALPVNAFQDKEEEDECEDSIVGPTLPPAFGSEEDTKERIRREFEERAESMKNSLEGKSNSNKKLERESWMTELPPELSKNFGLGPRKFRANNVELGDRSVWTDTPADRERKKMEEQKSSELRIGEKRKPTVKELSEEEIAMQNRIKEYNEKMRPQSLLEMHQKKQKKTDNSSTERRPFDRERDLAFHRTDPKEKANFIAKAKGLNSKFSQGSYESKFL